MRKHVFAIFMIFLCTCAGAQDLVILHTNDTHSHIDPVRAGEEAGLGGVIERAVFVDRTISRNCTCHCVMRLRHTKRC